MRWKPFLCGFFGIGPAPYHRDGRAWMAGSSASFWVAMVCGLAIVMAFGAVVAKAFGF